MKKGWIIALILLVGLSLIQQRIIVLSEKTNKTTLLAQYNDTSGCVSDEQRNSGWDKLGSLNPDNQTNIDKCINDSNNDKKWCCVCFGATYPAICSQLFSVLSGTPPPPSPTPTITPMPTSTPMPINCTLSAWSTCSLPCGIGLQTRSIIIAASNGGTCDGPFSRSCYIIEYCPVDCVWSDWSACSKDCGEGTKTRTISIPAAYGGKSCTGTMITTCINKLCSSLGTGGLLTNTTSIGQVIILSNLDPTPIPIRLPTPTPEPAHFNVIDYYLQAFRQPTPTTIPAPTLPPPVFIPNQSPTSVPVTTQLIPTAPPPRPESIIPGSLAAQTHTKGKTSFILNTASISEINIIPNPLSRMSTNDEKPFLSQEQKLLAQNVGMSAGGIMVTLQQKTGSQLVTRQDELTVQRGNQFFSISNQNETVGSQTSQSVQKNSNTANTVTDSSQTSATKLEINANNVIAQSSMALSVDPLSGILIVETPNGPQRVSIMPDEALGIVFELKALNTSIPGPSILLVSENGKLIYRISGNRVEKFLGLFPIAIQKQILISADTGSVVKVELSLISTILSFFTF